LLERCGHLRGGGRGLFRGRGQRQRYIRLQPEQGMELRLQAELLAFDLLDGLGEGLQRDELGVHVEPGDIALRQRGLAALQACANRRVPAPAVLAAQRCR
jgi:hypothetical protein